MVKGNIDEKIYYQYAKDVVDGLIKVGNTIILACQRFLNDLERDDMIFDVNKADNVIAFIGIMKHNTALFAGKPFILLDWQLWIVANLYGFYNIDGSRRFGTAYIEIARKNGKTLLAAALGLYALLGEGESGALVVCAANSKELAKILLNAATSLVKSIDPQKKYVKTYRYEITFPTSDSFLKIVSADTSKLDGLNCSTFIIDEYHEAKDTKMWDVLKTSLGMRNNGLGIIITTSGFNKESPCYAKRSVGIDILHNLKEDDSFFCAIYTLDEEDDWTDESNWIKSCPCLDIIVPIKKMRELVHSAIINPSEEVGVKTKLLNLWCDVSSVWLPEAYIVKNSKNIKLKDFEGYLCFIGVDLAATSDLTAVAYLIEKDGYYYFKTDYYLPESALKEKSDRELYKYWKQQGLLKTTEGNVTDYTEITNDLMAASEIVSIQSIQYDKYNSSQWAILCTELGLPLIEYPLNLGNFNKPTRELERLILSGKAIIDNNEINRWCFKNVVLRSDHNGNVKPDKGRRKKKIDGVIAMILALGGYLDSPHYSNEILII